MVIIIGFDGHYLADTDPYSAQLMVAKGHAAPTDDPRVVVATRKQ